MKDTVTSDTPTIARPLRDRKAAPQDVAKPDSIAARHARAPEAVHAEMKKLGDLFCSHCGKDLR